MVLVVQVRSSVMCTPRNLVLLTLSTVELSMVSGGWSVEFLLLKSNTTSFVFSTLMNILAKIIMRHIGRYSNAKGNF